MQAAATETSTSGTSIHSLSPIQCLSGFAVLLSALWILPAALLAQAANGQGTRIALGAVSGVAKSQVMVPLYLTPDPSGIKVGSISATIAFETKAVTFLKAEEGFLLDGVNADFEADLQKDADDPNKSILRLEVATEGDERKALREGLILSLIFRVNDDAADGTVVPLVFEQIAAKGIATPPSAIEPLSSQNGTIEVILEDALPYVGCFFFTH